MSGAGRKHRAKHLTEQYLDINAWTGPAENQHLAICLEAPHGQHVRALRLDDKDEPTTQEIVLVPRKFHKVIWLRVKDIIVVQDGSVELKPSPEQLELFLQENADWRERVEKAKETASSLARTVERQPIFQQSKETTTSVLPTSNNGGSSSVGTVVEHDPLAALGNPNRQNIRHRQQFFFGVEDEADDEEEEEAEEEEEEGEESSHVNEQP